MITAVLFARRENEMRVFVTASGAPLR